MDEQTLSLIPATEEDLQYLNPEPQSLGLVPATEEDLQYITPEIREPTMQEMTSDFETFKMFRKAGAFDSGKTATEMVTEGISGIASDFGHWAKTLPVRFAQNFADDKYSFNRKAKAQAKATTLQTLGNLELDYKLIGAGISRGVDKVFGEAETEEDLRSSYDFFKTQADLEQQRQGKAAEMVTEGFLGMSPEFLTLGMPEEQRELIRSQQVMPDMKAARGGTLPADPLNFLPLGAAVNVAKGTGRATLKGAEKVLINETLQLAKLKDDMTKALSRVGDNTIKSRRLAVKQAPVKARLEKGLAEVTEKIAENQAKLKPLAAKRDMALTKLASDLPVGNPLKEFLNDALKEVPIKQPLNLTNIAGGVGLIAVGKPIEYLGNALQFIKTLPQETAINMLMKAGDKVGIEVTEQQANALIKSGVMGGVGYGGYSFAGEFTDNELYKLGGAVGALLGPQFLARFGRNTAILGRETMKPASDLPFFTRLASKDAEKMTTQLIDRTAFVPVESVARQVTGAAEGKVLSRMFGRQAFGNMSPGGQAAVNFLDRSGLGRYIESAGRMAKGVGAGGAVGGAFGLAASGGMDMPEAFYGGIGAGMLFGSAGAVGGEVARFSNPINHMEARYGDLYHYVENYLPAGQKESFNKLNRDVQMAVANKIVANPSLAIEYVSKGKDKEGGYFDRVTGDIVINVDSPRAIEPLLAHEFTHYLEQTGGKRKFIDLLIGNPITGKPGIFVQRVTKQNKSKYPDLKVGDPIMVGEGANRKFLLSDEFETARSDYGKKLQDTLLDSDGNKMSDSDLAKIMTDEQTVSEIVAEHGTDFLLNDKRKYRDRNRGTIGKIMGGILDTELVQNIPLLRKTLAMMGGTFRPDGQLITDNKLFSNLKRYPQITELVRKYNNQLEGMSPQKRQAQETSGQIQGRDIKSGGRSTKEVVVDIKSAELAKSPQLAELLRSGTLLQIDKDGNVIPNLAMTSREQGKYNRSFAEKMKEAIEEKEANEGLPEGHVRPEVNPKTGKIRFVGRYLDDSVIDKLEQSGNWNKEQIQTLRDVNFNIRNKGGNEYLISYFKAAGQGGGKYVNAKVENHIEVPYGFEITQKNNIILRTVSVNQLVKNVDQLARQQQAELTRLYGADVAQAKVKLLQDLDKYHRNHADGQPGRTGLDANKDIAKAKADFINSAFGSGTKAEAGSNPWRASLGKKNPRDVYRSRRIERIGKMDQLSGTRFIDYDKINKAFIPKPEADVTVTDKLFMPASEAGAGKGTSALDILKSNQKPEGLPKVPTILEIAEYFKKEFGNPIDYKKSTPEQNRLFEDLIYEEVLYAQELHPEAAGWYDENLSLALSVLEELDPTIKQPDNNFIFKSVLAATSDGNKVQPQFDQTWATYNHWKDTGEISGKFVGGDRISNIKNNLLRIEAIFQLMGGEGAGRWLSQKGTIGEIRKAAQDDLGYTKAEASKIGTSELVDEVVPYAVILGPKLGSFFNNLYGDYSTFTMDRWFMRTVGRNTGTQVVPIPPAKLNAAKQRVRDAVNSLTPAERKKIGITKQSVAGNNAIKASTKLAGYFTKKQNRTGVSAEVDNLRRAANALNKFGKPLKESPQTGAERRWLRERLETVQSRLRDVGVNLENADLQALLWYNEKEIYEKLGYRSPTGSADYAGAAEALHARKAGKPSRSYADGTGRVGEIGRSTSESVLGETNPKEVNFLPAGNFSSQPANRITRQAPAMPGNRFMVPAASAGARLSERFR